MTLIQSKALSTGDRDFCHETLHVYAENAFVNVYNQKMLEALNNEMFVVPVINMLPINIAASQRIKEVLDRNQTDSGGLASVIKIKVNSRVMLTVNLDLSDRPVNGQLGTVKVISKNLNGEVTKYISSLTMQVLVKRKLTKTLLQSKILGYR